MAADALKGFPKTIQTALRDGKTDYATRLFKQDKYLEEVKNNSWDLIPVITEHLTEAVRCTNPELFKCCKHLLTLISESSNSEEALLQFVSEIEEAKENAKFIALLEPLYKVICRIPSKKINSLAWSFNAIQTYLVQCNLPDYENLEGKERLLVDNSEVVSNITRLYMEVIIFYSKFISAFQNDADKDVWYVLRKFLIQLLGTPLCYLNMELVGNIKTDGRVIAEDIVEKVFKTMADPFVLTEMRHEREHDELVKPDTLSTANLFYLIYYERVCLQIVPKIYSSSYIFESSLFLLCSMLKTNNNILSEKALKLAQSVFASAKGNNLSYMLLDCDDHSEFCITLSNVIVYNQSEPIRKMALQILNNYIKAFEIKGVYLIISNLINELTHSGLKGYLITFYKDVLGKEFQHNEEDMSEYFKGSKLFSMLRKFCHLNEKEETNLMENSDQIVSSLNLLRYLALRDKNNTTQFWDFSKTLWDIYLEPLRKGIELSRAHYELEIENINKAQTTEVSVTVHGKGVARMEKEEKLNVLNSTLTAFDVMHSLLSRVIELLESKEL